LLITAFSSDTVLADTAADGCDEVAVEEITGVTETGEVPVTVGTTVLVATG